jgi:hypothetical protein
LTYQKFGGLEELDVMGDAVDKEVEKMKKSDGTWK